VVLTLADVPVDVPDGELDMVDDSVVEVVEVAVVVPVLLVIPEVAVVAAVYTLM
jgi:hypothetical protein